MAFWRFFFWEQLSGANVTLVEDRPDMTQKTIQISGTPDQTERAQSLLQGFILSSKSLSDTHIQLYFVDMHARFLDSLVKWSDSYTPFFHFSAQEDGP